MPDVYLTTSQRVVTLTEQIGGGGEGDVYALPGDRSRVCKVYHATVLQARGDELARKLAVMVASPPQDPYAAMGKPVFAWPVEILTDAASRSQCVGFVMPRISYSHPLHVLYSAAGRRSLNFPQNVQPYYVAVATARNLALAFDKLHARGYVMADVNEENLRFRTDATVSLIDNDSFQVRDPKTKHLFLSSVMKPEYWPVDSLELAGKKKPLAPAHDCFCLAVFIFRLLMNGAHPFYGIATGEEDPPSDVENIAAGRFPYTRWHAGGLIAPLQYPSFNALPRALRNYFTRCFTRGTCRPSARPTAAEWLDTLDTALSDLVECPRKHLYFRSARTCPWCEIQDARATCPSGHHYDRRQGECPECAHARRRSAYRAGGNTPSPVAPPPPPRPQPALAQPLPAPGPAQPTTRRIRTIPLVPVIKTIARSRLARIAAALVIGILLWQPLRGMILHRSEQSMPSRQGINPKDGAAILLVPAGSFEMGSRNQENNPPHTVTLSDYWIYKNDVTVAEYRQFCKATGRPMPHAPGFDPKWSKGDHPIVNVSWEDARAYAEWAGGDLPTEAQWEKAARGAGARKYPWGNEFDDSKLWCSANTNRSATAPVGKYDVSPYGCTDLEGNVSQWCLDYYDAAFWDADRGEDPVNKAKSLSRVTRGGSLSGFVASMFDCSYRSSADPTYGNANTGFRCVLQQSSY